MIHPASTPARRAAAALLLVAGLALWRFAPERRMDLLPRVQRIRAISDRFTGGTSNVHATLLPRGIRFQFALDSAAPYPWAGINLRLADSSQEPIDFTRWRALDARTVTSPRTPLRIQILSDDQPSGGVARDSAIPIYHIVEFGPTRESSEFPWDVFQIPSWWRDQHGRDDLQRLALLDRTRSIEFHNGFSPNGPDSASVDLTTLELVGPNRTLQGAGIVLAALGTILLLAGFRRRGAPPPSDTRPSPGVLPAPVILDDPRARQRDALLDALRTRFSDPDLGLESFAASQGLSPRLAAALVKEATNLHFKGALNELRLGEAARLLRETKANISEIGYAVGFQNPSHFGRAFRERFGKSPSEYRTEG